MAVKPWRHALCTNADANHDLPIPVGPADQQIVMLANPGAGAETQDDVAGQPARRGEIDVLERRRIAELRVPQALGELALLARGPFGLDEQAEAVVEAQSACWLELRCWSNAVAIAVRCNACSLSIVGWVSMSLLLVVVGRAAQVLVRRARDGQGRLVERQPILLVVQNVFDRAIAIGAEPLGALTRGFERSAPWTRPSRMSPRHAR